MNVLSTTRPGSRFKLLACFVSTIAVSAPAGATAVFQASGFASLSIDSIVNLTSASTPDVDMFGDAIIFDSDSFRSGPAAEASVFAATRVFGTNPLVVGDGIELIGDVDGRASPVSDADAFFEADGLMTFENRSLTDDYLIQLTLRYSLDTLVSTSLPDEYAATSAFVDILSLGPSVDFVGEVSGDSLFGPLGGSDAGTILFDMELGAGEFEQVTLLLGVAGFAESLQAGVPVPEPGTMWLYGLGALAVVCSRIRRRTKS